MLAPLGTPLTREQARHLLGRATFSTNPARLDAIQGRRAEDVVREWMGAPRNSWFLRDPTWLHKLYPPAGATNEEVTAFLDQDAYYVREVRTAWMKELLQGDLRNRMALFWHNHFVTDVRKYRYASLAFRYVRLLQSFAFGDFRRFVKAVTTEGAMLYYLDGRFSTDDAPNENYARELLELFTMGPYDHEGRPNYTQSDVVEASRALTGWRMDVRASWSASHAAWAFDSGSKTVFGRTGPFDASALVDLVFEERSAQVARFISRKLIAEFVHTDPDDDAVDSLAEVFRNSGFSIEETLAALLGSAYFFEAGFRGVRVKSPVELLAGPFSMGNGPVSDELSLAALRKADEQEQVLLAPPNVAGWPGHHTWLNTDLMPRRWTHSDWAAAVVLSHAEWQDRARSLTADSSHPAVDFAVRLAQDFFAMGLEHVSVPVIDEPFGGDLDSYPLPESLLEGPEVHRNLVKLFLAGLPWYEWEPSSYQGLAQILNYVRELARLPEYQLC